MEGEPGVTWHYKGLMPNGSLRMRGRQPSEATKLRALCFLKLFLLISMV